MATGPITSWQIEWEDMEVVKDFTFLSSMITADGDSSHEIKRHLLFGRKAMTNLNSILKSRDIILPTTVCRVKAMFFSCSNVWNWGLDHKDSWSPKNWCFWIVVLEETLESSLNCKENKPIHSEGNQPWVLTGRTDPEAEAPILWPSHEIRFPAMDVVSNWRKALTQWRAWR